MRDIHESHELRHALLSAVFATAGIAFLVLFLWFAWKLLFLLFAGLLLALVLRSWADLVRYATGLSPTRSYVVTVLIVILMTALAAWFLVPRVIDQAGQLAVVIPRSLAQIRTSLSHSDWGQHIVHFVGNSVGRSAGSGVATTIAAKLADTIAAAFVVLVVGLYGGLNPGLYLNGLLRLFPVAKRERARHVGSEVLYVLRWWLLGQLVPMTVLGLACMIGLRLLHVPLAFILGLFTGLMIFVPYVGALLSEIPAVLVAFERGPETVLYVLILYLGTHVLEAYILTPFVQKRAVRLPPILTIVSQFLLWTLTGILGVAIATPLAAVALVLVRMLYLHEEIEH